MTAAGRYRIKNQANLLYILPQNPKGESRWTFFPACKHCRRAGSTTNYWYWSASVSIAFIGMALGAVASGWLADRFGRKTVFAATMAVYSTATGLCAFAPDIATLLTCRFFVGVGLGGQLPVAVSLVSEYAPPKVRGRFIVLLESFWGLGWLAAALASYFFIPKFGWHSAFLIGALPIVYIPLVLKFIPESVPYLLSQGKTDEAHRLVSRLEEEAGITPAATAVAPPQQQKQRIRFLNMCW